MSRIDDHYLRAHLDALGLEVPVIWAASLRDGADRIIAEAAEAVEIERAVQELEAEMTGVEPSNNAGAKAIRRVASCAIYSSAMSSVASAAAKVLERHDLDASLDVGLGFHQTNTIVDASLRGHPPVLSDGLVLVSAVRATARVLKKKAAGNRAVDHLRRVIQPLCETEELFGFWVTPFGVVAVPEPLVRREGERLHDANGPAIEWPNERHYFWHGVQIPEHVATGTITLADIFSTTNVEVRRVLMERFGFARYMLEAGGEPIDVDPNWGALYRREVPGDEDLLMVNVRNSTPEPDGSFKQYWLRVPPTVRTAREAIAWTFGLNEVDYAPDIET